MTHDNYFYYNNSRLKVVDKTDGLFSDVYLTARYAFYVTNDSAKFWLSRYPDRDKILPGFEFIDARGGKYLFRAKKLRPLGLIDRHNYFFEAQFEKFTQNIMQMSLKYKFFDNHMISHCRDMAEEFSPRFIEPVIEAINFYNWVVRTYATENEVWRIDSNPANFMQDRFGKIYWHDPLAVENV